VSAAVGRDHVVNLVIGNRYPFSIHFDFVVVTNHATLGWATIMRRRQRRTRNYARLSAPVGMPILSARVAKMTWWINHVGMLNMPFKKGNKLAKGSNGQHVIYHRYISKL
jgi:hypothetical protein